MIIISAAQVTERDVTLCQLPSQFCVNCQIILTVSIRRGFAINHLANGLIWDQRFGLKSKSKVRNWELHNPNSVKVGSIHK